MSTDEMEKYKKKDREEEAGICIMGEMRKDREEPAWQEKYEKEHKLRQEAEGELIIIKGIGNTSPEMKKLKSELVMAHVEISTLQNASDRIRKENSDLYNRVADALEVNESHQKMNGKLQERLTEVEEENKKMHNHLHKRIDSARKSGL